MDFRILKGLRRRGPKKKKRQRALTDFHKYYRRVNCPYCGRPFYAPRYGRSMQTNSGWTNLPRKTAKCRACKGEFMFTDEKVSEELVHKRK